jgi:hypothetical protein
MQFLKAGVASILVVALLALLPAAGATTPVTGTITSCSSNWACDFVFNTSVGHGWANGSSTGYLTPGTLSLKLPGESSTSTNLTYSTFIERLTGTYTYWTVGSFLGTDVNTGTVVFGTTDSNYTITCHGHSGRGGGCTYTYTTDNGSVAVTLTSAEMTATTLACSPLTLTSGKVTCTATVTNLWNSSNVPTGKLHISFPYGGKPTSKGVCTLSSSGSCKFSWTAGPNLCGAYTIVVTYSGSHAYYTSTASKAINLTDGC